MDITKKQVLKTILLPGILPRMKGIFDSGFSFLAYLVVLVYNTVRIIPDNHAYLKSDMVGKYSVRQAIAAAANQIKVEKKNIDQIVIFFSVISALFIMLIQFVLLIAAIVIPKAQAAGIPKNAEDFFKTPNPQEDIAFRMLDLVFGIPDIFNSKEIANATSLHKALHSLFELYSFGIILVGSLIIVYFVVAIVSETAVSGTPFGQRFNKAWAPIRVVLFFGLLVPFSSGINGGQYITLMSAKLGSGLASTGWILFNEEIEKANSTPTGRKNQNVAHIKYSNLSYLPGFMLVVRTCKKGYDEMYDEGGFDDDVYWPATFKPGGDETGVQAWAVYKKLTDGDETGVMPEHVYVAEKMESKTFQDFTEASNGAKNIHIVFGVKDEKTYTQHRAGVAPICGSVSLKVTDVAEPGSAVIQTAYFDLVKMMWKGERELDKYAESYIKLSINNKRADPSAPQPTRKYIDEWLQHLKEYMGDADSGVIKKAIEAQVEGGKWEMSKQMKDYGWAGAAIWYNKIAQQNGALVTSIRQTPAAAVYPTVMEIIAAMRQKTDKNVSRDDKYTMHYSAGGSNPNFAFAGEIQIANALNKAFKFWEGSNAKEEQQLTGNVFVDTVNAIFGTYGLFEICKNTDIHPLAQLAALGKSMLDNAIASFMSAMGVGVYSILIPYLGAALTAASKFYMSIAAIGLMVGFILFYVLPFFPFIYFFFAVGGWVKGIFEAMVAMPLWALAHLRIDGDGIPGEAAIKGYFLLFEIFIRPILIVFGLLAAISIFAAMVKVLNEIFYLVIANVSGNDPKTSGTCFQDPDKSLGATTKTELQDAYRGPLDEFFFTVLYTIIVYMIGISAFKLIDAIPNSILRWMGEEIESFNDSREDGAAGLMKYVTLAGSRFGDKISGSLTGLQGGASQSVSRMLGRS